MDSHLLLAVVTEGVGCLRTLRGREAQILFNVPICYRSFPREAVRNGRSRFQGQ
jgi:hypothetical protein